MRLWPQQLITKLPCIKTTGDPKRNQLGGLHRECVAMRQGGWERKHATVDYVWRYSKARLAAYHWLVMDEMQRRGFRVNHEYYAHGDTPEQYDVAYRLYLAAKRGLILYPEHNAAYLAECVANLQAKGVEV